MHKANFIIAFSGAISISLALAVNNALCQENQPMVPMAEHRSLYSGMLRNQDANQIEEFRRAGLTKDRSQISSMVVLLARPIHISYTYTTIHALAQMGAAEALPIIDTYIQDAGHDTQDETKGDLHNFSTAARARLVAEDAVKAIPGSKAATTAKVKRFYKELGVTSTDLNASLSDYYQIQNSVVSQGGQHWASMPHDIFHAHPTGVYAVRELADMMYHGDYANGATMPEVSQVNFVNDYPSALKMRLAPLSPSQRLATMLQELSQKKVLTHWDDYEIQLASNEGLAASHAAAALLIKMEANPTRYQDVGFMALVRVMSGTGDREQAPLVQRLMDEKLIYSGNIPLNDLVNGVKRGREPAY